MMLYKLFCTTILIATTLNLYAQRAWTDIHESKVPEVVKDQVGKLYPAACGIHWGVRYVGRTKLVYHAHGVIQNHPFAVNVDKDGNIVGKVTNISQEKVPEAVRKAIADDEKAGWKFARLYHKVHKEKDTYRVFYESARKERYMRVIYDENGKQIGSKHISRMPHGKHHVIY
ncbi:MAG: hypothetical protein RMM53_07595 [Bacteroidia bacterium]|nr:hypothetical protein [Bacteroidia bacterium]MDW8334062.1 hypothetical protein [Bacteroidia bacterium]